MRRLQKSDREKSVRLEMEGLRSRSGNPDESPSHSANTPSGDFAATNLNGTAPVSRLQEEREEREGIVLWRQPAKTLKFFALESFSELINLSQRLVDLFYFV